MCQYFCYRWVASEAVNAPARVRDARFHQCFSTSYRVERIRWRTSRFPRLFIGVDRHWFRASLAIQGCAIQGCCRVRPRGNNIFRLKPTTSHMSMKCPRNCGSACWCCEHSWLMKRGNNGPELRKRLTVQNFPRDCQQTKVDPEVHDASIQDRVRSSSREIQLDMFLLRCTAHSHLQVCAFPDK